MIANKQKKISKQWYFLFSIIILYILIYFINKNLFYKTINYFSEIFIKVIPVFIIIFILMVIVNYFITNKFITKQLSGRGIKKWIFVIIGGILSTGPIYMWYPLLSDLKEKGLNYGLISCFLYNRAIKIPLIPLAIIYFGWKYILVLSIVMILISVTQGILINKLLQNRKRS